MSVRKILALCLFLAGVSGSAAATTAEELVAKNLEARGGEARLRAITTIHRVGTVRAGGGSDAKVEAWAATAGKFRSEFSLQGMTAVRAWDGNESWSISPFGGRRDPQKLSADDSKDMIEQADIAGPLCDYKAKGHRIEYLGTEDIDGTDAHKLRVTMKNGDTRYVYLDPDAFLEIRVVDHRLVRGQDQVQTTDLGEYEEVDGIWFPFESGTSHLDTLELNQPLDPKMFAFPGAAR